MSEVCPLFAGFIHAKRSTMETKTAKLLRKERMQTPFNTLVELFSSTKQTEGRSPKTIIWYREKLRHYGDFLGNGSAKIENVTMASARAFIAELQGRDYHFRNLPTQHEVPGALSTQTIHGYVRCLKVFSSWMYEEGFTNENVLGRLKRPKVSQPVIEILSATEIDNLVGVIDSNTIMGARQHLIVMLLLDTGMRAGELCTLTMDNVHEIEGYVKVHGKGDKERIIPICGNTKKSIIHYRNTWRPEPRNPKETMLVLTDEGDPLTVKALLQIVKRLGVKAGIPRLYTHLFRHTFAVSYLMNGGDVMTLRLMLGHTSLDVTMVYMHLASAHVQIQHAKFSPVDRLVIKRRKQS
jgi:site-specific recombinase XerD